MADLRVQNEGSLFLLYAESEAGEEWVEENISQEGYQPHWPDVVVVEHRYIGAIVAGAQGDGLEVE